MHGLKCTHPNLAHRQEKGFQMVLWIHGIVSCGLCLFPVFPNWDLDGTCSGLWCLSSLPMKPWAQVGEEELGLHGTVEMGWVCVWPKNPVYAQPMAKMLSFGGWRSVQSPTLASCNFGQSLCWWGCCFEDQNKLWWMSKGNDNLWLNPHLVNSSLTEVRDGLFTGLEQHATSDFSGEMLI